MKTIEMIDLATISLDDIREHLVKKTYKTFPLEIRAAFVEIMIKNYKEITMSFDDLMFFMDHTDSENGGIVDYLLDGNQDLKIKRIVHMTKVTSNSEVYDIIDLFYKNYGMDDSKFYSLIIKSDDIFDDYYEGVVSFFSENMLEMPWILDMYKKVQMLSDIMAFDWNEVTTDGREQAQIWFKNNTISETLTYHFALMGLSEDAYIKYIYANKLNRVTHWSTEWPTGMWMDFIDAMGGDDETYFVHQVSLPIGEAITNDDYEFYENFLNLKMLALHSMTKEQLIEYMADFPAEIIITSGQFSVDEIAQKFSIKLYSKDIIKLCLRESDIEEHIEAFTKRDLNDGGIWVSDSIWNQLSGDAIKLRPYVYLDMSAQKPDFSLEYLEYLIENMPIDTSRILQILATAGIANAGIKKKVQILNRLYR